MFVGCLLGFPPGFSLDVRGIPFVFSLDAHGEPVRFPCDAYWACVLLARFAIESLGVCGTTSGCSSDACWILVGCPLISLWMFIGATWVTHWNFVRCPLGARVIPTGFSSGFSLDVRRKPAGFLLDGFSWDGRWSWAARWTFVGWLLDFPVNSH